MKMVLQIDLFTLNFIVIFHEIKATTLLLKWLLKQNANDRFSSFTKSLAPINSLLLDFLLFQYQEVFPRQVVLTTKLHVHVCFVRT